MSTAESSSRQVDPIDWAMFIPQHDRTLYRSALEALTASGRPCAIGGGLAFSVHTRRWRHTKDMDLYIRPEDSEAMTAALQQAGFPDFFEKQKYDRGWSYRGHRDDVIVDLLWGMANYRSWVDDTWFAGPVVQMEGLPVRVLAAEELLWAKLYVMQRSRCDWPDLLNIIYAVGPQMDWDRVLRRVADDAPVVGGLLSVFSWLCPASARKLPEWLWERVGLSGPTGSSPVGRVEDIDGDQDGKRASLLSHGSWFGPTEGPVST
jgi:hypothetical protein